MTKLLPLTIRHAAILAAGLLLASAASAEVTEKISKNYPFNADGVISLSNVNGNIEIVTWDKNEVSLEAVKSASSEDGLALIDLQIEQTPAKLAIKVVLRKKWKFWTLFNKSEVRFKLMVPAGVSLQKIDVVNSDVRVHGVKGYVDVDSVNGSINVDGLTAGGRFDTVNGSIHASFNSLSAADRIVLDTVNGSCTVVLPANAAFTLKADSVNGRVSCDFPITISRSGRRHLNGTVNGGGATVVLDSVNGSLTVRSK
jgi:DUF4097 and DUF4098 domain-containing protein YvlB